MKTWLVVVSVAAVLLVAATGVGFWMLSDTKAQLTDVEVELTSMKWEEEQELADETPTYWWEEEQEETTKSEGYWWEEPSDQSVRDLERRIEGLEADVAALQSQVTTLQSTLQRHGIY